MAGAADGGEVVRLAELMYRSLGVRMSDEEWARWRQASLSALGADDAGRAEGGSSRGTDAGPDHVVFVVDHPDEPGRLVACGAGVVSRRLPLPWLPEGLTGYVQWMSTEPSFQRLGLGRAVLRAVLGWFEARGVDNVELHASAEGEPLYRSEGFWHGSAGLPMRRRPWDPPPGPAPEM